MHTFYYFFMQLSDYSLTALFAYSLKKYDDAPFLSYVDGPVLTYRQFARLVAALQRFFREKGVRRGDRILLLGQNQPRWGVAYFAAVTFGAVIVPVLTDFHPDEIMNILRHSGARGLFISEKMRKKMGDWIPASVWQVRLDDFKGAGGAAAPDPDTLPDFSPAELERLVEETEADDLAAIIYTSGTTGAPKGVMLTHRNIMSNVVSTSYIPVKMRPGNHLLSILPLAHTYECTIGFLTPMYLGAHIFYLRSLPAPSVLMPALEKVRPHVMLSVPLLMEKIYKNLVLPKVRTIKSCAACTRRHCSGGSSTAWWV
jgi:long-chain acyl-CoA synthetase